MYVCIYIIYKCLYEYVSGRRGHRRRAYGRCALTGYIQIFYDNKLLMF